MEDALEVVAVPVEASEVQPGGLGTKHGLGNGGVAGPQLRKLGGFPKSSTPEEARARVAAEVQRWKDVAQKAGIAKR